VVLVKNENVVLSSIFVQNIVDTLGAFVYYESVLEQSFLQLAKIHREDGSNVEQRSMLRTQRASAQKVSTPDVAEEYDDVWPPRMPSSVLRYRSDATISTAPARADVQTTGQHEQMITRTASKSVIPPRRTATATSRPQRPEATETEALILQAGTPQPAVKRFYQERLHWSVYVGIALIIMVAGWIILSAVGSWWTVMQDDLHYGRPRTYQTDSVVGHDDSAASPSHFIALNLNHHVQVIEFPGGDATKAHVYMGPVLIGPGQDLTPVTLLFKDVNHDGKPDMIITVQGSHFVFINDNGQFRPPHPGENAQF
jgi:hypothetical protein